MNQAADAPTRLVIDLDALTANYRLLADRAKPARCAAVVKANAYGLGVDRVAPALAQAGCETFFVATLDEDLRYRIGCSIPAGDAYCEHILERKSAASTPHA